MLKYWLWLSSLKGIGARSAFLVAQHFSSPKAAYEARLYDYMLIPGLSDPNALMNKSMTRAEEIIKQCQKKDIRIITMDDADYPRRLLTLDDAPVVLYVRGDTACLHEPAIGIVGTRKSSVYGLTQAKRFGCGLAACGCTVVSGGAKGVDTEALRGALMAGGRTITVLGCGIDVNYPKPNYALFREAERRGCMLSEYPPGTEPLPKNFPVRNRLISGLSLGVLIAEAPKTSGALITADRALNQGRDVFVLPANVGVSQFQGNLMLLRDGAIPVGEPWDILQEYARQYPCLQRREAPVQEEPAKAPIPEKTTKKVIDKPKTKAYIDLNNIPADLGEKERTLLSLLQSGPMHIDDLVKRANMPAAAALSCLTMLEVKALVARSGSRVYELAQTDQ